MTINAYIYALTKRIRESETPEARLELQTRLNYAKAYKSGADALKRYRDRAIEREIGKSFSEGAQIAILFNKDAQPGEYLAYQTFRYECKEKVDAEIEALKNALEMSLVFETY